MVAEQSAWDKKITPEAPLNKYKFYSVGFDLEKSLIKTNRETYSLLDWVGDIGGLLDGLFLIGDILVGPFATYALSSKLVATIVRFNPSSRRET